MKIVHVISTLNIGGAENFCVQLANEQALKCTVEIIILNSTSVNNSLMPKIAKSIRIHQLKWQKKYSLKQLFYLIKHLKLLQPSVVHVHLHNPFYYVYISSFFLNKIKFIHTIHSNFDVWRPIFNILNSVRFANNKINHVCISKSIYDRFVFTYAKLKFSHVNNGIKIYQTLRKAEEVSSLWNKFGITDGPRFLAIGNLTYYKNFSLLAHTLKSLKVVSQNVNCVLIGEKINENEYLKIIEVGADNLHLAGSVINAADYLSQADALLISSSQEGMPIVALEALSLGVPVITTPAGGMKDVVQNGYNGFIAQDFEMVSFENCISQWIKLDQHQKNKMKECAFKSFHENYNIESISQQYINLYER